jgi:hypothetical protein
MFVQHKNVFYHCMKYLVIKGREKKSCHRMCVPSDDEKKKRKEKKKFVVFGHNEAFTNSSQLDQEHITH